MFTGIVKGIGKINFIEKFSDILRYGVEFSTNLLDNLQIGASVSIDGVCQTVIKIDDNVVFFDAIPETLSKTTLSSLYCGQNVNIERAAKFGDEIGGHSLSGHVYGKVEISEITRSENHQINTFKCPRDWLKYFFKKGFVAIDGISLTLAAVDETGSLFSVHLIPETLRLTTLGRKQVGEYVNIEIDSQTQTIVETLERMNKNCQNIRIN